MCLCGNLGLLKENGQYSTLAPFKHFGFCDFFVKFEHFSI